MILLFEGRGPVYGTLVHTAFAAAVRALNRPDLFVEQSFDLDGVAQYGGDGTIRTDVILGPDPLFPLVIYDLKTGAAILTQARANQILSFFPNPVPFGVIATYPQSLPLDLFNHDPT